MCIRDRYKGLHAVEQAFQSNDKETGCTVHYVSDVLDSGEIIDQSVVPICPEDTVDKLTYRIQQAEDGIRDLVRSRGLGDVYKRQL